MATKQVVFESDIAAYLLVREPKVDVPLPTGTGYHTIQKGITYKFDPTPSPRTESGLIGILRVKVGADKRTTDGERWLAEGHEVGEERDAVEALMAHRQFGHKFWLQQVPASEVRKQIRQASVALDEDILTSVIETERASAKGRPDLIEEAQDALELIRGALDAAAAEQQKTKAKQPA